MAGSADLFAAVDREITIAYAATYLLAGMMIVIALAMIATAIIIAFVGRRPGGYWMVSGVIAFAANLGLEWYLSSKHIFMLAPPLYVEPLLVAAKLTPMFLYSIGLARLAWSLRSRDDVTSS